MKPDPKQEDPWRDATFEGVERLQLRQTARMTFPERLQALDEMICLAKTLRPQAFAVHESDVSYGNKAE
ncbi:MAG: hypothetical protein K9M54_09780 [Kiritimatiellales bacterium]|nr:hypothetical protein [Kiritimatiellales bacterium]MCF7863860.1 hypothetical protein [Kiritimatiellales bacterium]